MCLNKYFIHEDRIDRICKQQTATSEIASDSHSGHTTVSHFFFLTFEQRRDQAFIGNSFGTIMRVCALLAIVLFALPALADASKVDIRTLRNKPSKQNALGANEVRKKMEKPSFCMISLSKCVSHSLPSSLSDSVCPSGSRYEYE